MWPLAPQARKQGKHLHCGLRRAVRNPLLSEQSHVGFSPPWSQRGGFLTLDAVVSVCHSLFLSLPTESVITSVKKVLIHPAHLE